MTVRVIEAKEDKVTMADLIADIKKSNKIDYSGAIFTFDFGTVGYIREAAVHLSGGVFGLV